MKFPHFLRDEEVGMNQRDLGRVINQSYLSEMMGLDPSGVLQLSIHRLPSAAARGGCWAHLCNCSAQVAGASFQSWLEAVSLELFSYFCKKKKFAFFTRVPLPQDTAATPALTGPFQGPSWSINLAK